MTVPPRVERASSPDDGDDAVDAVHIANVVALVTMRRRPPTPPDNSPVLPEPGQRRGGHWPRFKFKSSVKSLSLIAESVKGIMMALSDCH